MNRKIIAMTESSAFQLSRLPKRTNTRNDYSEGYFIIIIIIIYFLKPHQGFPWEGAGGIPALNIVLELADQTHPFVTRVSVLPETNTRLGYYYDSLLTPVFS